MKHLRLSLFTVFTIAVLSLQAQTVPPVMLHVETSGTLPSLIQASEKYQITHLTLSGNLNGTDILFIREMAGAEIFRGNLAILDLSQVHIVEDGSFYRPHYYTEKDQIGDYMFSNCRKLTNLFLPNSIINIGEEAFGRCYGLTSVSIGSNVTNIGKGAFDYCTSLTSLTIPNSVTNIEGSAFENCLGLTSLTIPSSVTSIGHNAFYGCNGLTEIHVQHLEPLEFFYGTFSSVTCQKCTLYVPEGSYDSYRAAKFWDRFISIKEENVSIVNIVPNSKYTYAITDGIFIVDGLRQGGVVCLYDINGKLLFQNCAADEASQFTLPARGVYIVSISSGLGTESKKIVW